MAAFILLILSRLALLTGIVFLRGAAGGSLGGVAHQLGGGGRRMPGIGLKTAFREPRRKRWQVVAEGIGQVAIGRANRYFYFAAALGEPEFDAAIGAGYFELDLAGGRGTGRFGFRFGRRRRGWRGRFRFRGGMCRSGFGLRRRQRRLCGP